MLDQVNNRFLCGRSRTVRVRPGEHTLIRAYLEYHSSDHDKLRNIDVKNRECLFPDEQEQRFHLYIFIVIWVCQFDQPFSVIDAKWKLFKNYSKDACLFECALAEANTVMGCTPWQYPRAVRQGQLFINGNHNQPTRTLSTGHNWHLPYKCGRVSIQTNCGLQRSN